MSPPTSKPVTGGIRKSLLTPARRIGLSRKVPTPDNIANLLNPNKDSIKSPDQTITQVAPKVIQKAVTNKSIGKVPFRIGLSKKVRTSTNVNKILDILSPGESLKQEVHTPSKINDISSYKTVESPKQNMVINSMSKDATPTMHKNLLKPVKRLGLSRKVRTPDNLSKLVNSPILNSVQKSPVTPNFNERQSKVKIKNAPDNPKLFTEDSTFTESEISNKSSGLLEPTSLTPQIQMLKVEGSEISSALETPNKSLANTENITPLTHKTKKSSTDIRVRPQSGSQHKTPVTHVEAKRSRKSLNVAQQESSDQSQESDDDFVVKRCRKKLKIFDSDASEKSCDLDETKKKKVQVSPQIPKKTKTSIAQKLLCKTIINDSDTSSDDEPLSKSIIKRKTKSTTKQSVEGLNEELQSEDEFASDNESLATSVIKRKAKFKSTSKKEKSTMKGKQSEDEDDINKPTSKRTTLKNISIKEANQSLVVDRLKQNSTIKQGEEVADRLEEKSTMKPKRSNDDFDSSSDDEPLARSKKIIRNNSIIKQAMQSDVANTQKSTKLAKQGEQKTKVANEFPLNKSEVADTKKIGENTSNVSINESSTKQVEIVDLSNKENNNSKNIISGVSPDAPLASSLYRISSKIEGLQRQPSTKSIGRLSLKKSMSSTSFATDTDDELTIKPNKSRRSNENVDKFMKECYINIQGMSNLRVNSFSDTNSELIAIEDEATIKNSSQELDNLKPNSACATPNSKCSTQENSLELDNLQEGTPKSENSNVCSTPNNSQKVLSQDNLKSERQQALELHFRIIEKEGRLADLQRAESTKKKHNVQELQNLTALWKTGCQNALCELLKKLQENGPFTMETLLSKLNTTSDFVGYDSDKGVFI